jgi:hypothetical protein
MVIVMTGFVKQQQVGGNVCKQLFFRLLNKYITGLLKMTILNCPFDSSHRNNSVPGLFCALPERQA